MFFWCVCVFFFYLKNNTLSGALAPDLNLAFNLFNLNDSKGQLKMFLFFTLKIGLHILFKLLLAGSNLNKM